MMTVGHVGHALIEVLPRAILQLDPGVICEELGLREFARIK